MTRRDAIAPLKRVLLAKLVLIRQSKILLHLRLRLLRQHMLVIRLRLQKLAYLLSGDLHVAPNGGIDSLLVTPLPADREILPADHLIESMLAVATDIIEFRLERGDLGVAWILFDPQSWGEDEGENGAQN